MSRILIINTCGECHYFEGIYPEDYGPCRKLKRNLNRHKDGYFKIPKDCPLPKKKIDFFQIMQKSIDDFIHAVK